MILLDEIRSGRSGFAQAVDLACDGGAPDFGALAGECSWLQFDLNPRRSGQVREGMGAHLCAHATLPRRFQDHAFTRSFRAMPPTYVLARDHLQRAATILQGADSRSRQLRYIIERTISLMDDIRQDAPQGASNVLDFAAFRQARANMD
ncbi:hypothetical protein [Devosia sp.]|uniref:hypothetical protein n=1 Tax=Devosia sp. TaxID=1871048 RepID=UPI002AFF15B7|nr:hypothetical protein [Devosia sp.]